MIPLFETSILSKPGGGEYTPKEAYDKLIALMKKHKAGDPNEFIRLMEPRSQTLYFMNTGFINGLCIATATKNKEISIYSGGSSVRSVDASSYREIKF